MKDNVECAVLIKEPKKDWEHVCYAKTLSGAIETAHTFLESEKNEGKKSKVGVVLRSDYDNGKMKFIDLPKPKPAPKPEVKAKPAEEKPAQPEKKPANPKSGPELPPPSREEIAALFKLEPE